MAIMVFINVQLGQQKLISSLTGQYQNDDAGCGSFNSKFMIFWVDAVPFLFFKKSKV